MKTTELLQRNVVDELAWDASVDSSRIAVTAGEAGVVTLMGSVNTYPEKLRAEEAVKRVAGVRAVANNIEVQLDTVEPRDDTAIAKVAVEALNWNTAVPRGRIQIEVEHGWITLDGEADWEYQRRAAERAVRDLYGVKGVSNLIRVQPRLLETSVKERIESAFERSAQIDANSVMVDVDGTAVTLTGTVRSWTEEDEAVAAAWSAPGVTSVKNNLHVESFAHAL